MHVVAAVAVAYSLQHVNAIHRFRQTEVNIALEIASSTNRAIRKNVHRMRPIFVANSVPILIIKIMASRVSLRMIPGFRSMEVRCFRIFFGWLIYMLSDFQF